ncbi:MAG TPA: hypothetical protein V6D12_16000, partial [Candidatus Obscuribacterales bacterium]
GRLLWRTLRRSITQEEVCNGNQETLQKALFSHDSILLWALQTYQERRREYPILFKQPEYAHLTVVHLCSPQAARDWLSRLKG